MPPLPTLQKWIEREIKKQQYGKHPATLYEPIRYLMNLGGKRLRPLLTLLSYSLFRDNVRSIIPIAVAVEVFHNFTLMHDDIMDRAPLRRGHKTVHEKWDVNTAILAGDVMLVKVYEMFAHLDPAMLKEVLHAFNSCAAQVCEGQQLDMEFETMAHVTEARYIQMIRRKTAVLLGFSLELGAILAGAPAAQRKALREFGINIGIGFQLKDDLLDAFADPKKFGKQVGGDIIANKKTFLLLAALEKAKGKNKTLLKKWLAATTFSNREKVNAVKDIYEALGLQHLASRRIDQCFRKGFSSLGQVSASPRRIEALRSFTETLIARQS